MSFWVGAARQSRAAASTTCVTAFASLLLAEGRNVIEVARQLGHGAQLTLGTYGHVMEELSGEERVSAEAAIEAARSVWSAMRCPWGVG